MPPSQLKRLKASLREKGITGPQKAKKQKKNQKNDASQRSQKVSALASIREASNPFDFKHLARPKKFDYFTNRPQDAKQVLGRPGVTKSQGEETRRKTLLPEMNRRNKVGGIMDRRIGEDDPTMSLDDRMMARFEREQQGRRGGNVFDLEEAEDDVELTHGGRSLRFDGEGGDYDAASVSGSSDGEGDFLRKKRRRDADEEGLVDGATDEGPERKKTKKEVMDEVIAKSKQFKYERQQQKEDDEDLIEELDKGLPDILAALRGEQRPPEPPKEVPKDNFGMNPDRAALLAGKPREQADKEYDERVRQMLFEQKSKPTERTKTDDEIAQEDAERLESLEKGRLRRMTGVPEDEVEYANESHEEDQQFGDDDDAREFGLGTSHIQQGSRPEGFEMEEDDFVYDEIMATESEADMSSDEVDSSEAADDTLDQDFLKSVLPDTDKPEKAFKGNLTPAPSTAPSQLAYTYPCPRTHEELLDVLRNVPASETTIVVQRIRALYHAGLHADNREKLADFACAILDHICYLSNHAPDVPLTIVETLIRHIHSLSKSYPLQIGIKFREHLKKLQESNNPTPGDLSILTAIGSIYPTSDHFHQVVTPAITLMARWLGLTTPSNTKDIAIGAYIIALCIKYQQFSKRYIPEAIRYIILSLQSPHITSPLIAATTKNILALTDLWSTLPAFIDIFTPLLKPLSSLIPAQTTTIQRLNIHLHNARLHRRPQELHHHRPLPIKSSVPKFEESFNPHYHYDNDASRAEERRLQKEYKREKKGALRELRKDANFIAREKLKDKKEKDRRYEEKYHRLIADIQGEEGREANAYERERRARKRKG